MITLDIHLKRDNFDVVLDQNFGKGITGIFGPSGSGKTSLLHVIAGLAVPHYGSLSINGKTVFDSEKKINIPVEKRNIGYVFQEGRLFPHMTVKKNLLYGIKKDGSNKLSFDDVVALLHLEHLLDSKPSHISGGERQRTALGRSLLSSPQLLLLDEPFSAVDVNLREQILPFLLEIHRIVKIPLLVVSHDIPDLLKLTNRLCILEQGKCIGHNDYHQLLRMPQLQDILGGASLINSVTLKVIKAANGDGLTVLSTADASNQLKVLCEKSHQPYKVGEEVKVFIKPDDIALSSEKLDNVTIQNQLLGTISEVIERQKRILCMVDVGFLLVVEITAQSLNRMEIKQGSKVWCLFKSVAIDVAG